MEPTGNETLDRIQQEIQEALQREEELRKKYNLLNNNEPEIRVNGYTTPSPEPVQPPRAPLTNGTSAPIATTSNSHRLFAPNASSKGVMHKFLKMRGKLNIVTMKPKTEPQTAWVNDNFDPAKVTIEAAGKPIRNGYVPAEEKMRRELQEFQKREEELRMERRKSQPDLMAALEREAEVETNLRPRARSMAMMYSSEDLTDDGGSAPASLKPARSLAELCDASDEELETKGTHSLILQFEKLRSQS